MEEKTDYMTHCDSGTVFQDTPHGSARCFFISMGGCSWAFNRSPWHKRVRGGGAVSRVLNRNGFCHDSRGLSRQQSWKRKKNIPPKGIAMCFHKCTFCAVSRLRFYFFMKWMKLLIYTTSISAQDSSGTSVSLFNLSTICCVYRPVRCYLAGARSQSYRIEF